MSPQDFIAKWGAPDGVPGPAFALNEEQGAQSHFLDLCELLDVPKPGSAKDYLFEEKGAVIGGRTGYADVFMRGVFVWENKAPGGNLDAAFRQLLAYSFAMSSPPILVVSDRLTIRIHTQFTGHPTQTHLIRLEELDQPDKLALLRRIWNEPESFKPRETSRDITEAAARNFADLAKSLQSRPTGSVEAAQDSRNRAKQVAHFLTQCLFCFFAEDVGLLPGRMFERLVKNKQIPPERLTQGLTELFATMGKGGLYGVDDIPRFNGNLFMTIDVPQLSTVDVAELRKAASLNWSAIDVSIIGTLFERGLDPDKRSQLGAHYTDTATIDRLIDPVLRRPLLEKWDLIAQEMHRLMARSKLRRRAAYTAGRRHFKATAGDASFQKTEAIFHDWLESLKNYRVLDPACGSGNFLYLGLKCLKDIELKSHLEAAALGLDRQNDLVTGPHNVLGIELNEYAAELARVTVWIGELQWRTAHGYEFKTNPVLESLDHIECRDALLSLVVRVIEPGAWAARTPEPHTLRFLKSAPTSAPPAPLSASGTGVEATQESGVRSEFMRDASPKAATLVGNSAMTPVSGAAGALQAVEATWPKADVVIGNPPFLGGSKKRRELGDEYFESLDTVFTGRVPAGADLVCYWFEKARNEIESRGLNSAGLVATNSIRGGANRKVLDAICNTTRIYEAWSDETWVNNGAAVRVSLVCFGHGSDTYLDGQHLGEIHSDLTGTQSGATSVNLADAKQLTPNAGAVFEGLRKDGPLDISGQIARGWLRLPNPNGKSNALVLYPLINGMDVTRRSRDGWVIDTGESLSEQDASLFEAPFAHIVSCVKPIRLQNNDRIRRTFWWRFGRNGEQLRASLKPLSRYINTPRVSKHRLFVFQAMPSIPDTATVAITRADDTTFGVLHSRFHELWSLRMCTWLGVGNDPRYTPTTCFETFPFPTGLTPADTAHQQTEQVEGGALIPAVVACADGLRIESAMTIPLHATTSQQNLLELRAAAIQIATAAKKLNDLREAWLNPKEWTHRVPEVTPLGMSKSPYPDRVEPKPGISADDLKALQKRTLTNLYNLRPQWLVMAHQQLDLAVAQAYGWSDYSAGMPDEEILKRLLALNLQRSATIE
jgi:hypothetical protein